MIKIKHFVFNGFQVNTYVLHDQTNEAVIIDPACESENEKEKLINYIRNNNLIPKYIANTHGHVDHLLGVNTICEHYNIPFYLHSDDNFLLSRSIESAMLFGLKLNKVPVVSEHLVGSDILEFGKSRLKLLHIPGHSPGSLAYYSKEDNFVIVGDVLFFGSIGRTDLPGGEFETLITGIKTKLLSLPRETVVFSGHGQQTTIGHEYDTNPFLV